jgi:hypothetical protein
MNSAKIVGEFNNPSSQFRAKPFWAWNDALEADELRRQILVFKEMGFGGFLMHSRVGLKTPYLGKEWFEVIKACIDEAKKGDMEAWLYDEDRWPSGAGGGFVTSNPDYQQCEMVITNQCKLSDFNWPDKIEDLYIFAILFEDEKIRSYQKIENQQQILNLEPENQIVTFTPKRQEPSSWYNNTTYLDTLNTEAVLKFIEVTHEAYKQHVGDEFGKAIPGIFTDEPNYGTAFRQWAEHEGSLPWTTKLPQFFAELFDYDITSKLPELFFPLTGNNQSQARHHFYRCITRMFAEAFSGQIGKWCEENNLLSTGHVLEEDPISSSISTVGSQMQFYAYMQSPGVDILTQYRLEYTAVKQCVSVARQRGRKWVMSELYGCTGWETTFETYKHSGDWQAVLGITLRVPHLSWYSMAGEAKRDYPASIHFQSPWHKEYKYIEDYFSRVNVLMTAGKPVCDLVVIYPGESYTLVFDRDWEKNDQIKNMDKDYNDMVKWLLGGHVDFDFAEEHLLVEFQSSVDKDEQGPYLQIGEMKYRAVFVPPVLTIRQTTFELLVEFDKRGGTVLFASSTPELVDASTDDTIKTFASNKTIAFNKDEILRSLRNKIGCISINDENGNNADSIFYQMRKIDNDIAVFLVNTDREKGYNSVNIEVKGNFSHSKQIQLLDAMTGQRYEIIGQLTGNSISFKLDIAPSGSRLIMVTTESSKLTAYKPVHPSADTAQLSSNEFEYSLDDHNVLVLDKADCTAQTKGKEKFKFQDEILQVDRALRKYIGIESRGALMVQPWANPPKPLEPPTEVKLQYSFHIDTIPPSPISLGIEQPTYWKITINGNAIDSDSVNGWWTDPAIKTIPVDTSLLKKGQNTLTLAGRFGLVADLEIVYLLGDFGVSTNGINNTITELPPKLSLGTWTNQGLPFYSGNVTYHTTYEHNAKTKSRRMLSFQKFTATAISVKINESEPLITAWPQYHVDITEYLKPGGNKIEIKLLSSRRNSFGPLHLADEAPPFIVPQSYRRPENNPPNYAEVIPWDDKYRLIDYGMVESPVILECI